MSVVLTPVIPALGRPRQKDYYESEVSLGYILSSKPGLSFEILAQKQNKTKSKSYDNLTHRFLIHSELQPQEAIELDGGGHEKFGNSERFLNA